MSGANNEHWNLIAGGDGTYRIVNVYSGRDLEDNGVGYGKRQRSQWQDNGAGSTNDFWRLTQDGNDNGAAISVGI